MLKSINGRNTHEKLEKLHKNLFLSIISEIRDISQLQKHVNTDFLGPLEVMFLVKRHTTFFYIPFC